MRIQAWGHVATAVALGWCSGCGSSSGASSATPGIPRQGTSVHTLADWPDRPYLLYVPTGYDGDRPFPVVVAIHGGGADAVAGERLTCPNGDLTSPECFAALADREGFLMAFPNGTGEASAPESRTFNAGGGGGFACVAAHACELGVDDVRYFDDLLDAVTAMVNVDPQRVYVTGMSNGGAMSHRLGCERADRIAAIGPVSGGNEFATGAPCTPGRPLPVLEIHGEADPLWPYEGGLLPLLDPPGLGIGAPRSVAGWAARNGCAAAPESTDLPTVVDDGTSVVRLSYSGCSAGADVLHYRVVGGGHTWPRGNPYAPESSIGKTSQQISANEVLWEFFRAHPKP